MDQLIWDAFKAYATLAHAGRTMGPDLILKATDRDGHVVRRAIHPLQVHATAHDTLIAVHERATSPPLRMIRHSTAYLVARNLTEVVRAGTATAARKIGFPAAGKTGTLPYDVWFAGFSDRRVALAWIGEDRRTRTIGPSESDNRIYGSTGPLPVWVEFMSAVDKLPKGVDRSSPAGPMPDDVEELSIDPETSLLANPDTPGARLLPHRRGTGPTTFAPRREDLNDVGNLETEF